MVEPLRPRILLVTHNLLALVGSMVWPDWKHKAIGHALEGRKP